jgi:hypothetical protein
VFAGKAQRVTEKLNPPIAIPVIFSVLAPLLVSVVFAGPVQEQANFN